MKKILLLLLPFILFSCVLPEEDTRKTWDSEYIAFENNSDLVPRDYREETYHDTGFIRNEGTSGIVGKFTKVTIDTGNLYKPYSNVETYIFKDDGTYQWTHVVKSGNSVTTNFKTSGTYKLYIYSDKYYLFELVNRNKFMFYRVSNAGADITDRITTDDGNILYADIYAMSLK